ncbi:hypothetical protein N7532_011118 [Penicillium argentinense]|uniref:Uncharacterized protein n=1 Tax=Penicillium argentinense TaxID=1131581 RepID=A0A9W9EI19_9EURO|nr:uncharacterized protein N7532_011118 [Penicillium argentinense]KAJ5082075.1 hypothetical protein N7532_011118 [Penicillium argentinense]
MSSLSSTRASASRLSGLLNRPQITPTSSAFARSSGPHRLNSSNQRSPPRPSSAPQQSRSNFPIIPIVAIVALGSGSYILLVKSRTGVNQARPSN